tara:strand:- start:1005 stop:1274 length:270 start_codon:yes stop_codon:yes gene_type:complete
MKKYTHHSLLDAICYSRHFSGNLTTEECILIHQYINGRLKLSERLWEKINKVMDEIEDHHWSRPSLQYDSERNLLIYNNGWQILKPFNN